MSNIASVIIPAHNEANVIERCLRGLTADDAGELEVVVVCNGCTDATAALARKFGGNVRVIEVDQPSKANALNVGDQAATTFPRFYADADIVLPAAAVREVARVLSGGGVLAASPAVEIAFPKGGSWLVRAYYDLWLNLPYVREGMVTAGVYGLSEAGRGRFGAFPMVISDDGYVRSLFAPAERAQVGSVKSIVWAPGTFSDLIKIRTRGRLGMFELKEKFPQLFPNATNRGRYGAALAMILRRPRLYVGAIPYFWVSLASLLRARRQARDLQHYVWERDESSRGAVDLRTEV